MHNYPTKCIWKEDDKVCCLGRERNDETSNG